MQNSSNCQTAWPRTKIMPNDAFVIHVNQFSCVLHSLVLALLKCVNLPSWFA